MTSILARVRGAFAPPGVTAALEISATHVSVATVEWERAGPRLTHHARRPLPDGALTPHLTSDNIRDRDAVVAAVRNVLDQLPKRPAQVGLAVPDSVAKVSFVQLEQVPARRADLHRLVAWQVKKAVPFRMEEAQMAYTSGAPHGERGRQFVVTLVRRDIVQAYESVCADAGVHAGVVDLTSFNLINTVLTAPTDDDADWLFMYLAPEYCTLAILRGEHLIFFRNRPASEDAMLTDLVYQTAMYYEDHLARNGARGLTRSVLVDATSAAAQGTSAPSADGGRIRRMLEERLHTRVNDVWSDPGLRWGTEIAPSMISSLAAPVGLLLRGRVATH
jgi:Tfp pilus assembly PilM family ATPase